MIIDIKAKLNYNMAYDNNDLFIFLRNSHSFDKQYLSNATVITVNRDKPIEPFVRDETFPVKPFMQAIMNEAWEHGMRPTGFKDVQNETVAIRYHLEDMRKLAFKGMPK